MEDLICSAKKKVRDLVVDSLKLAGKEPVRDVLILTPKDVKKKFLGKHTFTLSYRVGNDGYMSCKDFENLAYFNDKVVARHQGLSLGPNEYKVIKDDVTLDIKDGVFLVRIDAFSKVTEDDETNNDISCMVLFRGFKKDTPTVPYLHIELLRIAGKTPVHGRIKLSKRESIGQKKGRFAFEVEYVMRNMGIKDAVDFDNLFLLDGKRFFRQPKLSLKAGESKLVKLPVYFPIKNGKLTVRIDANLKYPKGPECSQTVEAQLYFQGFGRV